MGLRKENCSDSSRIHLYKIDLSLPIAPCAMEEIFCLLLRQKYDII